MYQFLASSELDLQLHDRRRICPLEYQAFHSRNNYAAKLVSKFLANFLDLVYSEMCFRMSHGSEMVRYFSLH
ncbi:hypothetical protein CsSME_00035532 [Camellia sinensis var. sinensis]